MEEVAVYHTDNQLPMQYSLDNYESMIVLAGEIARFVKVQKLSVRIQDREYVTVEGRQFAGACLGLVAIVKSVSDLSTDTEVKYLARTEIISVRTGKQVGYGESVCSNQEKRKRTFEPYAINSMTQTRSIGKAYRNLLSWLMKAAGFQPTPAEEMEFDEPDPKSEPRQKLQPKDSLSNDVVSEMVATLDGEMVHLAIKTLFGRDTLHSAKAAGITAFYKKAYPAEFAAHIKTFGQLTTVGDALLLLSHIPDTSVHPTLVRYWTEIELTTLVDTVVEVHNAQDSVGSQ